MADEASVTLSLEQDVVEKAVEDALRRIFTAESVGVQTLDGLRNMCWEMLHDQRFITAKAEAVASARIFADVEGVRQNCTPFRISSKEQLASLLDNMGEAIIPGKTQLAIMVAVVKSEEVTPLRLVGGK